MEPEKKTKIDAAIQQTKDMMTSLVFKRDLLDAQISALGKEVDLLECIRDNKHFA